MKNFCHLLLALILFSADVSAYGAPLGLYVLEYPVKMPDVSLINEHNKTEPILNTSADLTILIFWSQTCAPCLREMKYLERLYPKAKKDNINVMLVSPASDWHSKKEERLFLKKYGAPTIPFYNDVKNKLSLSLGIGTTPYTVIMDKNGKKIATIQGETDWDSSSFYKKIKKLIKN